MNMQGAPLPLVILGVLRAGSSDLQFLSRSRCGCGNMFASIRSGRERYMVYVNEAGVQQYVTVSLSPELMQPKLTEPIPPSPLR